MSIVDQVEIKVRDSFIEIVFNCVRQITATLEMIDFLILLHIRIDVMTYHKYLTYILSARI